ncbi:CidA/LrgA family protein [Kordiimonas lipolytica]|uniref:CidA/LrgA family protein n=1 Tax=Kordiimonas lipolytica TaxID=1662421 RepID=A0ABV8UAV4_9PROT|nr:CidA/LrgA family protein [Kordiimonas lipolytica]
MVRSLVGVAILVALLYGATLVVRALSLPLPAPILGLLALTAFLVLRRGVPPIIEAGSRALIRIFPLLFVPPIVALLAHKDLVLSAPLMLLLAVSVSTLIGLVVSAFLYRALARREGAQ